MAKLVAERFYLFPGGNITIGDGSTAHFNSLYGSGIGQDGDGLFDGFEIGCAEHHSYRTTVPRNCDSLMRRDDLIDDLRQLGLDF